MRLWIRSDLHAPLSDLPALFEDQPAHDVQVIAGDTNYGLRRVVEAVDALVDRPVVLVAGNHEFYHRTLSHELMAGAQASIRSQHTTFLERGVWIHGGVRFLGATLWTDFSLWGPDARSLAMSTAAKSSPDHELIMREEKSPLSLNFRSNVFSPADAREIHLQTVQFLDHQFAQPFDGPTVVVTHHAPARGSIAPEFAKDPLTPAYVSDLSSRIERWQPALWIHGHTHRSFDYRIGRTRVICNPRGFDGVETGYDPALVIDV